MPACCCCCCCPYLDDEDFAQRLCRAPSHDLPTLRVIPLCYSVPFSSVLPKTPNDLRFPAMRVPGSVILQGDNVCARLHAGQRHCLARPLPLPWPLPFAFRLCSWQAANSRMEIDEGLTSWISVVHSSTESIRRCYAAHIKVSLRDLSLRRITAMSFSCLVYHVSHLSASKSGARDWPVVTPRHLFHSARTLRWRKRGVGGQGYGGDARTGKPDGLPRSRRVLI